MAFRKNSIYLDLPDFALSINYVGLFIFINSFLFPKFYEKGKVIAFTILVMIGILVVGYIEELIVERFFYQPSSQEYPIANPGSVFVQVGVPTSIFIVLKFLIYFRDKQLLINKLEKEKSESQLLFLKSQINPHILFNNLNNIYSLSEQNDPRTSDTILKLSDLMRYVIYESSEDVVRLSQELNYLRDYIGLLKIQIEGRGKVELNISGNYQGYTIAPLLLVPFVENCFKHSMDSQVNNIIISVDIRIKDNRLFFETVNSFSSIDKNDLSPSGIGLKNTKERLSLHYKNKHTLTVNTDDDLYKVKLEIDLI